MVKGLLFDNEAQAQNSSSHSDATGLRLIPMQALKNLPKFTCRYAAKDV
jgi:hypothetical protein